MSITAKEIVEMDVPETRKRAIAATVCVDWAWRGGKYWEYYMSDGSHIEWDGESAKAVETK